MEPKKSGKNYKESIKAQAMKIKKMRESSASIERARNQAFQSRNLERNQPMTLNSDLKKSLEHEYPNESSCKTDL